MTRVAHRTSPTNMGLALLANLSAYDFGYISAGQLIERTTNALHTMKALERHRDHFYNWYDTQSLKPLPADLRVDGGQREPRGPSADTAARSACPSRSEDSGLAIALMGSATHSMSSRMRQGKPLRPSSLNFRRIWSLPTRPGPLRSRRRGSALTGWRHLLRRCLRA